MGRVVLEVDRKDAEILVMALEDYFSSHLEAPMDMKMVYHLAQVDHLIELIEREAENGGTTQ